MDSTSLAPIFPGGAPRWASRRSISCRWLDRPALVSRTSNNLAGIAPRTGPPGRAPADNSTRSAGRAGARRTMSTAGWRTRVAKDRASTFGAEDAVQAGTTPSGWSRAPTAGHRPRRGAGQVGAFVVACGQLACRYEAAIAYQNAEPAWPLNGP